MVLEAKTQDKAARVLQKNLRTHGYPHIQQYFKELVDNCWKFDGRTPIDVLSDITKLRIILFTELPGYRNLTNELLEGEKPIKSINYLYPKWWTVIQIDTEITKNPWW